MRLLLIVLTLLLIVLQYQLWVGQGSLPAAWELDRRAAEQQRENDRLRQRNRALEAEVRDLKQGLDAVEERARSELGMIRDGETFFEIVERDREADTPDDQSNEREAP